MSQTSKLVLGIAVAAIVLAGAYYYWHKTQTSQSQGSEVTSLPSGTDSSDSSLQSDLSAIDAQIQEVGNDTASVTDSVAAASAQ